MPTPPTTYITRAAPNMTTQNANAVLQLCVRNRSGPRAPRSHGCGEGAANMMVEPADDKPANTGIIASIVIFGAEFLTRRDQCPSDSSECARHVPVLLAISIPVDRSPVGLAAPGRQYWIHRAKAATRRFPPNLLQLHASLAAPQLSIDDGRIELELVCTNPAASTHQILDISQEFGQHFRQVATAIDRVDVLDTVDFGGGLRDHKPARFYKARLCDRRLAR